MPAPSASARGAAPIAPRSEREGWRGASAQMASGGLEGGVEVVEVRPVRGKGLASSWLFVGPFRGWFRAESPGSKPPPIPLGFRREALRESWL